MGRRLKVSKRPITPVPKWIVEAFKCRSLELPPMQAIHGYSFIQYSRKGQGLSKVVGDFMAFLRELGIRHADLRRLPAAYISIGVYYDLADHPFKTITLDPNAVGALARLGLAVAVTHYPAASGVY